MYRRTKIPNTCASLLLSDQFVVLLLRWEKLNRVREVLAKSHRGTNTTGKEEAVINSRLQMTHQASNDATIVGENWHSLLTC